MVLAPCYRGGGTAKGEVDYIGFGRKNLTTSDGTAVNAGMHIWEAKVGVNYRLSP
jgi:hypothetical protein